MSADTTTKLHDLAQPVLGRAYCLWGRDEQDREHGKQTVVITIDTLDALLNRIADSEDVKALRDAVLDIVQPVPYDYAPRPTEDLSIDFAALFR
jgi:hypothetical protein